MKTTAIYCIIVFLSLIVPINPVVVYLLTGSRSTAIYAGMIVLCALAILGIAALYLKYRTKVLSVLLIFALAGSLPALFVGEVLYIYFRETVGDQVLGIEKTKYLEANEISVYSPIPNAIGEHESPGNYDVKYYFDDKGRKKIEQNPTVSRTIHFFGDSFTFGYGVTNEDTALNILANGINHEINVQNYGVGGYSLILMHLRQVDFMEEVKPGDVVVFSPLSDDLDRGLTGKSRACRLILGKNGPKRYPRFVNGRIEYLDLSRECNFVLDTLLANTTFQFSIGRLYKSLWDLIHRNRIIAAADEVFLHAEQLALSRGASFYVVFFATARECADGEPLLSLKGLETPHLTLLPYCPSDPQVVETFHFPSDDHWTPAGNQWAAETLLTILRDLEVIH